MGRSIANCDLLAEILSNRHSLADDFPSSNFPRFDINPNTGEPLNNNRRSQVAENTIYLDAKHPSRLSCPSFQRRPRIRLPVGAGAMTGVEETA